MQHGASFDSCFEMSTIEEEQSGDGYNQSRLKKVLWRALWYSARHARSLPAVWIVSSHFYRVYWGYNQEQFIE